MNGLKYEDILKNAETFEKNKRMFIIGFENWPWNIMTFLRNQCEFNNRYLNRIILFCHVTSTDNLNTNLCCIIINLISRRGNGDLKVFNIFNMTLCINVFIYCIHFISCVCLYVNVCIFECVFMCMHNTILRFEFVLNLECLSSKRE